MDVPAPLSAPWLAVAPWRELPARLRAWLARRPVSTTPDPAAEPGTPRRARGRRVLRWTGRVLLGLLFLLILGRLLLGVLILPLVLDRVAARWDLACRLDGVRIGLLAGEVEADGLTVTAREGGPDLLRVEHVRVDLFSSALLRGRLHIRRGDVDGLVLRLERDAQGRIPLFERLKAASRRNQKEEEPEDPDELPLPDLRRLRFDAVRLGNARVAWSDASTSPPQDLDLTLALQVDGLRGGAPDDPARWALDLELLGRATDPATTLGRARLGGDLVLAQERIGGEVALDLLEVRPGPVAGYLRGLGLAPRARELTGGLTGRIAVEPARGAGKALHLVAEVERVALRADGDLALGLDRARFEAARLGPGETQLTELVVEGPVGAFLRERDGAIASGGVAFLATGRSPSRPRAKPEPEPDPPAEPSVFGIERVLVRGGALLFVDQGVAPAASVSLELRELSFGPVRLDPRAGASPPAPVRLLAVALGLGEVALVGTASSSGGRQRLALELQARKLRPAAIAPWLERAGIEPRLEEGSLRAKLDASFEPAAGGLRGEARLSGLSLADRGRELCALDELVLDQVELGPRAFAAREVRASGVRATGGREADGTVWLPGLALLQEDPARAPADAEPGPEPSSSGGLPPRLSLGRAALERVELRWFEGQMAREVNAEVALAGFELRPDAPAARLSGTLRAPGLVEEATLAGTLLPGPDDPALSLGLEARGIDLAPLAPLLARAGLEPALGAGELSVLVTAALRREPEALLATGRIESLRLREGQKELLLLRRTGFEGLRWNRSLPGRRPRLDLGRLHLDSLELAARLLPGERLELVGVRTRSGLAPAPGREQPGTRSGEPPILALREVEIDGVKLALTDARGEAPRTFEGALAARMGPLSFDPQGPPGGRPTEWRVELSVPGLIGRALLQGDGALGGNGGRLSSRLTAEGVSAAAICSLLPGRVELDPALGRAGRVQLELTAEYRRSGQTVTGRAEVTGVSASVGQEELVALRRLRVDGLRIDARRLEVGQIEVSRPRLRAGRDARGELHVAGVRLLAEEEREEEPRPVTLADIRALATPALSSSRPPDPEPRQGRSMRLGGVHVRGARIDWHDRSGPSPIDLVGRASLEVGELRTDPGAPPAEVQLRVRARRAIRQLRVDGTLGLDPERWRLDLRVAGSGLSFGRMGGYLPEGVRSELADGRLAATLKAELVPHREGGRAGYVELRGLELNQGGERPLLRAAEVAVVASRIDAVARRFELARVTLTGLETTLAVDRDGRLGVVGLSFGSPPPTNPKPGQPTAPAEPPGRAPARARPWPFVRVDRLELDAPRVQVWRPNAVPVDLALRLVNRAPLVAGGVEAEVHPPCSLTLSGSAAPVVSAFAIQIEAGLHPSSPVLGLEWSLAGVQGSGLVKAVPELEARDIDALGMEDGRLRGRVWFEARPERAGEPFDPRRGFGGLLHLERVALRDGADGDLIAGLESLDVDLERFVPSGPIHIRSVTAQRPAGLIVRTATEIRVLGVSIAREEPPPGAAPPPPTDTPPAGPPGPEVRIDELAISGADLLYRDETYPAPLVVPVSGLEVTLQHLVQGGPPEAARPPVEFDVFVELVSGREGTLAYSAPAVCDEIHLWGSTALGKPPVGTIGIEALGLRLDRLSGPARSKDMVIGGGVLDLVDGRIRLRQDGSRRLSGDLHLTDFRVSDPGQGGGALSRLFKVPTGWTLNQLTAYARDEAGTIEVPLDISLSREGEVEDMVELVLGIVGEVLVLDATRNLPIRLGLPFWQATKRLLEVSIPGQQFGEAVVAEPVRLDFAPGSAMLDLDQRRGLFPLLAALDRGEELELSMRHDLGRADLEVLRRLNRPAPEDVRGALERIELRRRMLLLLRSEAVAQGLEALRTSRAQVRPAAELMRALDMELGALQASRDQLLSILREGGDREAGMRLRQGSIELARARMEAVRDALVEGRPDLRGRVRISRPRHGESGEDGTGHVTVVPRRIPH